jgi:hypothetical protein
MARALAAHGAGLRGTRRALLSVQCFCALLLLLVPALPNVAGACLSRWQGGAMASSAPDTPGAEVLLPVLACAVGVSLWAVVEVARNRRLLVDEPDLARSSAGWEMRLLFHRLLALSNGLRALALVLELALGARDGERLCTRRVLGAGPRARPG